MKREGETVVKGCLWVLSDIQCHVSQSDWRGGWSSVFVGEWNCEWWESGFISRVRKGGDKGAEWISTFCRERGVMQRDCDAMSFVRGVHIGVLAIMWNELVKISEGNSKDKVIGRVHD